MLDEPALLEGRVHTGFLDEVLQQRRAEFGADAALSLAEVASVMACVARAADVGDAVQGASGTRPPMGAVLIDAVSFDAGPIGRSWKQQGRLEGLRS
jgi:hypothetical protein